ncbi:MAG: glycosyltransferase family 2 protein [Pseudomonadota bacterium]
MKRVSVIVPTFNRVGYLKESLDSLLAQTRQPDEIWVIDDGSSDDTESVAKSFGERVNFFRKPENSGKAASLNMGLELISGDIVWIMDDDDIALPCCLETLLSLLDQTPDAGFAYGRHMRFSLSADGEQQELGTGYWQPCDPDSFLLQTLEDFFPHQPGMIVRKSLFNEVGPFDVTLRRSQDYEMLIRLARAAPCVGTDDIVFLQRQHDGKRGASNDRFSAAERDAKWMEHDQQIFRKLRSEIALGEYLPRGWTAEDDAGTRRALLQRGVIFARKKLWTEALEDFVAAATRGPARIGDDELTILRRTFSSKYGCDEITEDLSIQSRLKDLKSIKPAGAVIANAIVLGMRWRIREALQSGDTSKAFSFTRKALSVRCANLLP